MRGFFAAGQFVVGQFAVKKMLVSVRFFFFLIFYGELSLRRTELTANCPTAKNPRATYLGPVLVNYIQAPSFPLPLKKSYFYFSEMNENECSGTN